MTLLQWPEPSSERPRRCLCVITVQLWQTVCLWHIQITWDVQALTLLAGKTFVSSRWPAQLGAIPADNRVLARRAEGPRACCARDKGHADCSTETNSAAERVRIDSVCRPCYSFLTPRQAFVAADHRRFSGQLRPRTSSCRKKLTLCSRNMLLLCRKTSRYRVSYSIAILESLAC